LSAGHRLETLRVQVDATSAHLPLAVTGSNAVYTDVDRALDRSVESAVAALAAELGTLRAQQLELFVELVEAQAEYSDATLVVRMVVRATLRDKLGNSYLAQTYARWSASAHVAPEVGAKIVLDCTDAIGSQLSGWLAGENVLRER
jgi:hypothetical protein